MPTFTPPVVAGSARGSTGRTSDKLLKYYGATPTGATVYKDGSGWHQGQYPYAGRTDAPGLNQALEYYLGGHTYEISDAKATELIAAGFQVGGHLNTEEQRWVDFAINSINSLEWKGGDGMASLLRPDNTTLWTSADNIIGSIDPATGFYIGGLPTRNALLSRDPNGVITQPKPNPGSHPAWPHPSAPTDWWWPLDRINDGAGTDGSVVLLALHMTEGGAFGTFVGNDLLTLSAFGTIADTDTILAPTDFFMVHSVYKDDSAGYHYIIGQEFTRQDPNWLLTYDAFTRLARVPIGSLTNIAAWQYWTGSTWGADQALSVRLMDNHHTEIHGNSTMTKVGNYYVIATTQYRSPGVRLLYSTTPQGPYTFYHETETPKAPIAGQSPPPNQQYAYYQPKFHEWLFPNASMMVLSYHRNTTSFPGVSGPPLSTIHASTYCPQFIYAPPPSTS
jgi:hypothetical protein